MEDTNLPSPELQMLRNNKEEGYNYRERRHEDWDATYLQFRGRVITNRLTQRQSVHVPLMKQSVKTLLKDVDDMPVLYFENLDGNKDAEIMKNEYWKYTDEINKMELQDIVDKKQVILFGRSFDQMQIVDGKVKLTIEDPMDFLVPRTVDPTDINSGRYFIHVHIFKPLSLLKKNPKYNKEEIARLEAWFKTEQGIVKSATNAQMLTEKNQKLSDMGVSDIEDPVMGETYVELSLHFVMRAETENEDEEWYVYTEAEDMAILAKEKHEDIVGVTKDHYFKTHLLYGSWGEDVERQDFWSDGPGDVIRPCGEIVDSWFSQLVENRTLKNFNMNIFDATNADGFSPQTWTPVPWGWYGVPGKPSEVYQQLQVNDLSDSLDEMTFVIGLAEKATGATQTQQGAIMDRQVTLGEVKLALGEAKERVKGMSKFYTLAWKDRGVRFTKLLEAGSDKIDAVRLYKKGKNTSQLYSREVAPKDWKSEAGYYCRVWSQDEKKAQDADQVEKMNAMSTIFADNPKAQEIYKRKVLEFVDLNPEDINAVMELEQQKVDAMMSLGATGANPQMPAQLMPTTTPQQQPQPTL